MTPVLAVLVAAALLLSSGFGCAVLVAVVAPERTDAVLGLLRGTHEVSVARRSPVAPRRLDTPPFVPGVPAARVDSDTAELRANRYRGQATPLVRFALPGELRRPTLRGDRDPIAVLPLRGPAADARWGTA